MNLKSLIIFSIILSLTTSASATEAYQDISNEEIILFIENYISNYNAKVQGLVSKEDKDITNDEGSYIFFLFKKSPFKVIVAKAGNKSLGFLFIPSNENKFFLDPINPFNKYTPTISVENSGPVRFKHVFIQGEYGTDFIGEVQYISIENIKKDIFKNAEQLAVSNFKKDFDKAQDIKRRNQINKDWTKFTEENTQTINNNLNLSWIKLIIDSRISNEDYTYNLFLKDFEIYSLIVLHYRDLPKMIEKWNDYKNSSVVKIFKILPSISSSYAVIENNITSNETYLFNDLESDIKGLDKIIDSWKRTGITSIWIFLIGFVINKIVVYKNQLEEKGKFGLIIFLTYIIGLFIPLLEGKYFINPSSEITIYQWIAIMVSIAIAIGYILNSKNIVSNGAVSTAKEIKE